MIDQVGALIKRFRKGHGIIGLDSERQPVRALLPTRTLPRPAPHQTQTQCPDTHLVHNLDEILSIGTCNTLCAAKAAVVRDLVSDEQLFSKLAVLRVGIKARNGKSILHCHYHQF